MEIMLVFAITLLMAVLISGLAQRGILSTAVLFLAAGFVAGRGVFDVVPVHPDDPVLSALATAALFSVLFTDGMRISIRDLVSAWRLPGRALLLGLPLTLMGTALLARYLAGLTWSESFLVGAALSPTDPVFAAAIVGSDRVPSRLRFLLNVESGLNDGLTLPLVLVMLRVVGATEAPLITVSAELVLGIVLGVVVPWLVLRLEKFRFFSPTTAYEPFNAFALGLLVFALASLANANLFLAAYAAGITVVSVSPPVRSAFQRFGEFVAELLKLLAVLIFGAFISFSVIGAQISAREYAFALLILIAVRPLAIGIALLGSRIGWPERLAAGWFGPKGFASIVYGILILRLGAPRGPALFHLIAIVVAGSIVISSSTDVLATGWLLKIQQQLESS